MVKANFMGRRRKRKPTVFPAFRANKPFFTELMNDLIQVISRNIVGVANFVNSDYATWAANTEVDQSAQAVIRILFYLHKQIIAQVDRFCICINNASYNMHYKGIFYVGTQATSFCELWHDIFSGGFCCVILRGLGLRKTVASYGCYFSTYRPNCNSWPVQASLCIATRRSVSTW